MMIHMKNPRLSTLLVLLLTCFLLISAGCELQVLDLPPNPYEYSISNPYKDIKWATIEYHYANFHTHTQLSDAQMPPHTVIDTYHSWVIACLPLQIITPNITIPGHPPCIRGQSSARFKVH